MNELIYGINDGKKHQVLLGATGTGKTFTMANVIASVNKPTLVLAHNKTLDGQLYSEFKELFPENRVNLAICGYKNNLNISKIIGLRQYLGYSNFSITRNEIL